MSFIMIPRKETIDVWKELTKDSNISNLVWKKSQMLEAQSQNSDQKHMCLDFLKKIVI